MLNIDTEKRSLQSEIMDDFDLNGEELRRTLQDLENVNSWLGGNAVTKAGIKKLEISKTETIRIVDIGCGNGAILRELSSWGQKNGYQFELIGVDANSYAIDIAEELSVDYPNVSFLTLNIFSEEFRSMNFDILLCTLTLHHFKDSQIPELLHQLYDQAKIGVVINDLQRSKLAYILFQAFCAVFVHNEIARKDGLISILRGFKEPDIKKYMNTIKVNSYTVSWKWAFRYLWVIEKNRTRI